MRVQTSTVAALVGQDAAAAFQSLKEPRDLRCVMEPHQGVDMCPHDAESLQANPLLPTYCRQQLAEELSDVRGEHRVSISRRPRDVDQQAMTHTTNLVSLHCPPCTQSLRGESNPMRHPVALATTAEDGL